MKRQTGFTLIELIAVVLILGSLAAVALPRFVNLKKAASVSALQSMAGALQSGANIIHGKAYASGLAEGSQILVDQGKNINLHSGYPIGNWLAGARYIIGLDSHGVTPTTRVICDQQWCGAGNQGSVSGGPSYSSGRGAIIWPRGYHSKSNCLAYYINKEDGSEPLIGTVTSGC